MLVKHVDFGRAVLHVTQAYSGSELKLPKSGTDREVPIDPRLHRVLTEAVKGKRPNDFVVVRASGEPPRRQHVWSALRQLQDKHGLPHRSVHSLRHAFCTFLLQRGADVESVREVAGHEDLKTTARCLHGNIEQAPQAMARLAEEDRGSKPRPELSQSPKWLQFVELVGEGGFAARPQQNSGDHAGCRNPAKFRSLTLRT